MNSVQWNSSIPQGVDDNLMTDNLLDDELVNSLGANGGIITPGIFSIYNKFCHCYYYYRKVNFHFLQIFLTK